jgi:hypothetical protein
MVSFDDVTGQYDWKISNLFGSDFQESAIITVSNMKKSYLYFSLE